MRQEKYRDGNICHSYYSGYGKQQLNDERNSALLFGNSRISPDKSDRLIFFFVSLFILGILFFVFVISGLFIPGFILFRLPVFSFLIPLTWGRLWWMK